MKLYKLIDNKIINTLNDETIAEYKNNKIIIHNHNFSKNKINKIFRFTEEMKFYVKTKSLVILYEYLIKLYSKKLNMKKIEEKTRSIVDRNFRRKKLLSCCFHNKK